MNLINEEKGMKRAAWLQDNRHWFHTAMLLGASIPPSISNAQKVQQMIDQKQHKVEKQYKAKNGKEN